MEALRENLDVISLTEHLEYQPHKDDIPHPDRNRSYALALEEARDHELLIVHGSEITRSAPVPTPSWRKTPLPLSRKPKSREALFSGTTRPGMRKARRGPLSSAIFRKNASPMGSCME